jgi:hypothetical protein
MQFAMLNIAAGVSKKFLDLVTTAQQALDFMFMHCQGVPIDLEERTNGEKCMSKLEVGMLLAETSSEECAQPLAFPRCADRKSSVLLDRACASAVYSMLPNETITILHETAAALHTECQKQTTEVRSTLRRLAGLQHMLQTWHTRMCRQAAKLLMDQSGFKC